MILPSRGLRPAACGALLLGIAVGAVRCGGGPPGGAPGGPVASGESLETILSHADAAFRDADYVEAQKTYEEALKAAPDHGPATANLGACYLLNRKVRKARELLQAYLARHPGDADARLVLARVFIRLGDLEAAAGALRAVLRSRPGLLVAHYNLGFVAYRARRYDEAVEHLKASVELKPDLPEAHYKLGLTYLALGRQDEAIASLEKAAAIDPRHVGARFNLANAYARAGRMREAREEQAVYADLSGRSKAQQEKDTQIKASSVRAIRYIQENKYAEALAEYEALARRHPGHAPLHNEIGRLQIRLGQRQQAFESLRKAVSIDARLSEPHYLLAGLYRDMGDAAAADRELEIVATLEAIPEGKSGY
ncbi:MAG: tetratricopeptide repeat protein [Acidobacteria bacterium]|nr:tetratricopeptide repeat protein [Acidobacteriota bacterium]